MYTSPVNSITSGVSRNKVGLLENEPNMLNAFFSRLLNKRRMSAFEQAIQSVINRPNKRTKLRLKFNDGTVILLQKGDNKNIRNEINERLQKRPDLEHWDDLR